MGRMNARTAWRSFPRRAGRRSPMPFAVHLASRLPKRRGGCGVAELIKPFARNTAGRDIAVGDIHGHFTALQRELDRIDFDPAVDRLFSVGDLVDRGPECEDVIKWLNYPWFHPVRG